jgi:hypothetical protein
VEAIHASDRAATVTGAEYFIYLKKERKFKEMKERKKKRHEKGNWKSLSSERAQCTQYNANFWLKTAIKNTWLCIVHTFFT